MHQSRRGTFNPDKALVINAWPPYVASSSLQLRVPHGALQVLQSIASAELQPWCPTWHGYPIVLSRPVSCLICVPMPGELSTWVRCLPLAHIAALRVQQHFHAVLFPCGHVVMCAWEQCPSLWACCSHSQGSIFSDVSSPSLIRFLERQVTAFSPLPVDLGLNQVNLWMSTATKATSASSCPHSISLVSSASRLARWEHGPSQ